MQIIIQELRDLVQAFGQKINAIPEQDFYSKPHPKKWSKIEVLGHLIDSAQNNLRRFICSQYESSPPRIIYDQDFWVASNQYSNAKKENIIQLWILLNDRIYEILKTMEVVQYNKECNTGKNTPQLHSLQWLADDYLKHMKHHLNQIIPGSFDIVYP